MRKKADRATIACRVLLVVIAFIFLRVITRVVLVVNAEVAPVQPNDVIRQKYGAYIDEIAEQYDICPELIEALIERESSGQADVVSKAGCVGLMQISPEWHMYRMEKLGVSNLFDPYTNILVGTDYLHELFEEYEDMPMVLMSYNGSSDALERWQSGDFTDYATWIMERAWELERGEANE